MNIKIIGKGFAIGGAPFEYAPGYVFTSDAACRDYDWLVVYDEMPKNDIGSFHDGYEPLACPKERTMLLTVEPTSIKNYSRAYTRQFGHLLTNRPPEAEKHPHYHLGRGYYAWFIGRTYNECVETALPPKTKLISVVCSNKRMRHTQHDARYRLTEGIVAAIPEVEWYGHGVKDFANKYEVLDPYKYHVTIENHIGRYHWSEKLADAFLAECLPLYAGDPAANEVFPQESFIPIPMDDPAEAAKIVKAAIAAGEYEKRREAILESKRLILEKYNFWAQVIEVIKSEAGQIVTPVNHDKPTRIYARHALRKRDLRAALEDGWYHLKQYLKVPGMSIKGGAK